MTPTTNVPPTIQYATVGQAVPPGPGMWWVALAAGLAPLTVGLLDMLAWLITSDGWTVAAGLLTIAGGTITVFAGFVCATLYGVLQARAKISVRVWLKTFLLFCVLYASNFAAAFGCLAMVDAVPPKHRVTITNADRTNIQSLVFIFKGQRTKLGPLPAGQQMVYAWRQRGEVPPQIEFVFADLGPRYTLAGGYMGGGPEGERFTLSLQPGIVKSRLSSTAPATQPIDVWSHVR